MTESNVSEPICKDDEMLKKRKLISLRAFKFPPEKCACPVDAV